MIEFKESLDRKLGAGGEATFLCRGGVGLQFVIDRMSEAGGYDIVVVMAGGNDLASGAPDSFFTRCYDRIRSEAQRLRVKITIFTSIWPRQCTAYNNRLRPLMENMMARYTNLPDVVFWQWDRRQSLKTYDGVHLHKRGYQKAVTYLLAPIVWAQNNKL